MTTYLHMVRGSSNVLGRFDTDLTSLYYSNHKYASHISINKNTSGVDPMEANLPSISSLSVCIHVCLRRRYKWST